MHFCLFIDLDQIFINYLIKVKCSSKPFCSVPLEKEGMAESFKLFILVHTSLFVENDSFFNTVWDGNKKIFIALSLARRDVLSLFY